MNSGLLVLGIFVIIIGFVIMGLHPYQKGRARVRGASAGGPVWFVILFFGIVILAVALYLPG